MRKKAELGGRETKKAKEEPASSIGAADQPRKEEANQFDSGGRRKRQESGAKLSHPDEEKKYIYALPKKFSLAYFSPLSSKSWLERERERPAAAPSLSPQKKENFSTFLLPSRRRRRRRHQSVVGVVQRARDEEERALWSPPEQPERERERGAISWNSSSRGVPHPLSSSSSSSLSFSAQPNFQPQNGKMMSSAAQGERLTK